jgi:hypothetical protein
MPPAPVSPPPSAPPPSAPPPDVYSVGPAATPPPLPTWEPEPPAANQQVSPSPAEALPPAPPPPPGEYTRSVTWTLSDRVIPVLAPAGLGLVFLLSFLPWSFSVRGTLNGWTLGFGEHANAIVGVYLLITMLAFVLSVPSFLFARNLAPAPPAVKALGPWRSAIVGGVALLAFVFMIYLYLDYIFSFGTTPGTIWMKLAVRCHLLALIGSVLEYWLEARRSRNLPPPRAELRW